MSLRDAIQATETQRRYNCQVRQVNDLLEDDDRETLSELIADVSVTSTRIVAALNVIGHQVHPTSMQRHRRGVCACQR